MHKAFIDSCSLFALSDALRSAFVSPVGIPRLSRLTKGNIIRSIASYIPTRAGISSGCYISSNSVTNL